MSHEADPLDHLKAARAGLEQALAALDSAVAGLPDADPVREIRASVGDALRRCVECIEGSGA